MLKVVEFTGRARLTSARLLRCDTTGKSHAQFLPNTTLLEKILLSSHLMSQTPFMASPSSTYQAIFDNALETYRKKTKEDLRSHPLFDQFESCHSPDAVLTVLREQLPMSDQPGTSEDRFTKCLSPIVNVLFALSATIGGGVSLVGPTTSVLGKSIIQCPFCRYTHLRELSLRALAYFSP